jgi:hypothetical protein
VYLPAQPLTSIPCRDVGKLTGTYESAHRPNADAKVVFRHFLDRQKGLVIVVVVHRAPPHIARDTRQRAAGWKRVCSISSC